MFDIFIESHFSAGHHLRDYPGNCEKPHGHNWHIKVTVRATELDSLGMGIDFRTIKEAVNIIMDDLDHCDLNSHPSFLDRNPSSENIAVHIFDSLQNVLHSDRYSLFSVQVGETQNTSVIYYGKQ
ncbi:MAG: 6-carboxytetrahydropterin synthase QueD [Desulfobulbaceae bacterium]|uniref:6-carboxy-5,6,7,8-tetrahydropterin synthase n=1 Tax=Candidatus Desulfobia pelagia TaxID=2841692 RepID=A0A8J6NG83_9BACT|nr:6-carboxytetrahydropterin synthase QueD [Candidatus Desulfobia pelagia]